MWRFWMLVPGLAMRPHIDQVNASVLQEPEGTDVTLGIEAEEFESCAPWGTAWFSSHYRVLKVVVKDLNTPSTFKEHMEFEVGTDLKKKFETTVLLKGVPLETANLELQVYVKQYPLGSSYFQKVQKVAWYNCGKKVMPLKLPDQEPHTIPFDKVIGGKNYFHQLVTLSFMKKEEGRVIQQAPEQVIHSHGKDVVLEDVSPNDDEDVLVKELEEESGKKQKEATETGGEAPLETQTLEDSPPEDPAPEPETGVEAQPPKSEEEPSTETSNELQDCPLCLERIQLNLRDAPPGASRFVLEAGCDFDDCRGCVLDLEGVQLPCDEVNTHMDAAVTALEEKALPVDEEIKSMEQAAPEQEQEELRAAKEEAAKTKVPEQGSDPADFESAMKACREGKAGFKKSEVKSEMKKQKKAGKKFKNEDAFMKAYCEKKNSGNPAYKCTGVYQKMYGHTDKQVGSCHFDKWLELSMRKEWTADCPEERWHLCEPSSDNPDECHGPGDMHVWWGQCLAVRMQS